MRWCRYQPILSGRRGWRLVALAAPSRRLSRQKETAFSYEWELDMVEVFFRFFREQLYDGRAHRSRSLRGLPLHIWTCMQWSPAGIASTACSRAVENRSLHGRGLGEELGLPRASLLYPLQVGACLPSDTVEGFSGPPLSPKMQRMAMIII